MESSGSWHPDPTQRHRARWYDGTRWTDWVSDDREAFRDPYGAPATATTGAATTAAGAATTAAGAAGAGAGAAGWFADPTGRYPGRYYDGRRWTEWVSTGGDPLCDPAGAPGATRTAAATGATPGAAAGSTTTGGSSTRTATVAGAGDRSAATAPAGPGDFWKRLAAIGPDVVRRPAPNLRSALGGAGGALAAVGLVVLLSGDSDNNAGRALAGVVLIGLGLLGSMLPGAPREARAAGTAAAAIGIAATAAALAVAVLPTATNLRTAALPLLFAATAYVGAWLAPGLRGRPLMIGLGALAALATVAVLVGGDSATALSIVLLLCAGGLLAFVVAADRRGLTGIGTTAIVAALVAAWAGTGIASLAAAGEWGLSGSDDCIYYGYCEPPSTTPLIFTGLLTLVVGVIVCAVGSSSGRRASTWSGAATGASGLTAFLFAAFEPTSAAASGTVVIVAGALLIAVASLVHRLRPTTATGASGS